jgi:hypothetical protein
MVSFLKDLQPEFCINISSSPCVLHDPPISFSLILSSQQNLVKSANYGVSQCYAIIARRSFRTLEKYLSENESNGLSQKLFFTETQNLLDLFIFNSNGINLLYQWTAEICPIFWTSAQIPTLLLENRLSISSQNFTITILHTDIKVSYCSNCLPTAMIVNQCFLHFIVCYGASWWLGN